MANRPRNLLRAVNLAGVVVILKQPVGLELDNWNRPVAITMVIRSES